MKIWYFLMILFLAISSNAQNPLCTYVNAPYSEDFQSSDWVINSPSFNLPIIDTCWNRNTTGRIFFKTGPHPTAASTGASVDHTLGNPAGKYVHVTTWQGSGTSRIGFLETPPIVLDSIINPQLTFWYHMFGFNIDTLRVSISRYNSQNYTTIFEKVGQQHFSKNDLWTEAIIDLPNYAGDTVVIRFLASQTSLFFNNHASIDDVSLHEKPSCTKPLNARAVASTDISVSLDWDSSGSANWWQIHYGPLGTPLGSGTSITTNQKPVTISGLQPDSTYVFYIRDSCGSGNLSSWSNTVVVKTKCSPQSAPWFENFDGPDFTPSTAFWLPGSIGTCWSRDEQKNFMWSPNQTGSSSNSTGPGGVDHTSGTGRYLLSNPTYLNGNANISTKLETPLIDLSPLNIPELRFWYHMYGADIDSLRVEVSNGLSWSRVIGYAGQQQTSNTDPWKEAIVDLSAYINDTIQLRFTSFKSSAQSVNARVSLDDMQIQERPACPAPQNLSATTTTNSANLSWSTGGANNWQVRYRQTGTAQAYTLLAASSNPFTLTGLIPATNYEFFVRDSCGPGDVSIWVGPVAGATTCVTVTAPWYENFDGPTWIPGTGVNNTGNKIDLCWTRSDTSGADFGVRNGPTLSTSTGPASDFSGSGNYLYTEASGAGQNQTGEITSPSIYIPSGFGNPKLKFAYHMFGININSLVVKINNGSGFNTSLKTITGAQHTSHTQAWKLDSVSLSAYAGDTVQFKFLGSNSGFVGDISIDEISVSGCNLVTTAFTHSTQNLQVNFNSSASANADSLYWDFGDGNSDTAAMPVHVYQSPGNYSVSLYGYNDCSVDTFTVNLKVCDSLTAGFQFRIFGDSVLFYVDSSVKAAGFLWDLDDGKSSTDSIVVVKYDSLGLKQVRLMTFNNCGDTAITSQLVEICPLPVAKWTYSLLGTTGAGMKVQFNASASQNTTKYIWDFGDGTIDSSGTSPVHLYVTPGLHYTVRLTVKNDCGVSDDFRSSLQAMVGLEENALAERIHIYPNPVSDLLYLQWEQGELKGLVIRVYDVSGKKLYHQRLDKHTLPYDGKFVVNTEKWNSGTYALIIETAHAIYTHQVQIIK